jgi:hypothetical protein
MRISNHYNDGNRKRHRFNAACASCTSTISNNKKCNSIIRCHCSFCCYFYCYFYYYDCSPSLSLFLLRTPPWSLLPWSIPHYTPAAMTICLWCVHTHSHIYIYIYITFSLLPSFFCSCLFLLLLFFLLFVFDLFVSFLLLIMLMMLMICRFDDVS